MSAYHSRIVEEFQRTGGTLTGPQVAAVVGFGWRRDLHDMRKAGYLLVEDAAGLWHLDLEALPDPDAGRAVDASHSRSAWEGDGSSPGIEGEAEAEPLFDSPAQPASPYDPSVEAA